jgi:hypothetical protein
LKGAAGIEPPVQRDYLKYYHDDCLHANVYCESVVCEPVKLT